MIAALRGLPLYIILGLLAALATTGFLLRGAWQGEARAEAINDQWQTAFEAQQQAVAALRSERAAAEQLVRETQAAREAEQARANELRGDLQEALSHDDEYQACHDVRLPADALGAIDRMRDPSASAGND
ncbi:hypothetical protein [Salinisphaera sp. T31B1]|uniref:hypothetical protein n=1 Tax=Salinisphaera sp. T31B1 TaxID=727963 RepID=UPI003342185A